MKHFFSKTPGTTKRRIRSIEAPVRRTVGPNTSLAWLAFTLAVVLILSCAHSGFLRIDPADLKIEYRVASREEYLNDPIKRADFGDWELLRHINYYHVENLNGALDASTLVYFVSLAGFETERFGVTVGPDDDARFTDDGGATWTKAPVDVMCRFGLDVVDRAVAWNVGNGGVRHTTDGGRTWRTITREILSPYVAACDADHAWIGGPHMLVATEDGGITRRTLTLPVGRDGKDIPVAAASRRTPLDGYLLDDRGLLYITADGGRTWARRILGFGPEESIPLGGTVRATVRFISAREGRVVFSLVDYSVWTMSTADGGLTWTRREIPGLKNRALGYLHPYLSRDTRLLTLTNDFYGLNESFILRLREEDGSHAGTPERPAMVKANNVGNL